LIRSARKLLKTVEEANEEMSQLSVEKQMLDTKGAR
jgi:hypothetical protein